MSVVSQQDLNYLSFLFYKIRNPFNNACNLDTAFIGSIQKEPNNPIFSLLDLRYKYDDVLAFYKNSNRTISFVISFEDRPQVDTLVIEVENSPEYLEPIRLALQHLLVKVIKKDIDDVKIDRLHQRAEDLVYAV